MIEILDLSSDCSTPFLAVLLKVAKNILDIVQLIGPLLLMVALTMHIIKAMSNPDDKKIKAKIKNSIIATLLLFFVPVFVNAAMNLLDNNFALSTCWNSIDKKIMKAEYIDPGTGTKKKFNDNGEYERGDPSGASTSDGTAQKIGDVVWNPSDVTQISNLTSSQLVGILNAYGGGATNFIPYASTLIAVENKYHVNVFFLIGLEALESGWITSNLSNTCNNLGGVKATSARPSYGCGIDGEGDGVAYFNSKSDFIEYHGSMLNKYYLTPGGDYYMGPSISGIIYYYNNSSQSEIEEITKIANGLFSKVSSVL